MPPAARQPPAQVAALQLHVSLNDIEPPIWRRFWVEETITLGRLHEVLQIVMGWENYHLHHFITGERFEEKLYYTPPWDDGFEDPEFNVRQRDETRVKARSILPLVKGSVTYEYDLGDGWEHTLLLEKVVLINPMEQWLPWCIDGRRACPPDASRPYQAPSDHPLRTSAPPHGQRPSTRGSTRPKGSYPQAAWSSAQDQHLFSLLQPPGGVSQGLIDVGRFQQWVGLQNPLAAAAAGDQPHDRAHRDAQPADAGFAAHHGGIVTDPGEGHGVIVGRSPWNPSFSLGVQQSGALVGGCRAHLPVRHEEGLNPIVMALQGDAIGDGDGALRHLEPSPETLGEGVE